VTWHFCTGPNNHHVKLRHIHHRPAPLWLGCDFMLLFVFGGKIINELYSSDRATLINAFCVIYYTSVRPFPQKKDHLQLFIIVLLLLL